MSKQKLREFVFGILVFFSDLVFLGVSFFISYRIRFIEPGEIYAPYEKYYLYYSIGCIFLIILILFLRKLYNYKNLYRGMGEAQGIIIGVLSGIFIVIIFNYYLQKDAFQLSRAWLFYTALITLAILILSRVVIKRIIFWFYRRAGLRINTLIVGINEEGYRIAHTFDKKGYENINIVGFVDKSGSIKNKENSGRYSDIKIIGNIENFEEVISKYNINRVIISSSDIKYFDILLLLDKVKNQNIEIQLSPSLFEFSVSRMKIFEYMGIPLIQIQEITIRGIDKFFKYLIDYSIGLVLFLLFLIIYPVIGTMIKLNSKGPVLFTQERYGKDFKKIRIYKFRTMRTGADKEERDIRQIL